MFNKDDSNKFSSSRRTPGFGGVPTNTGAGAGFRPVDPNDPSQGLERPPFTDETHDSGAQGVGYDESCGEICAPD